MSYTTTDQTTGLRYHHFGLPMSDALGLNSYTGAVTIRNEAGDAYSIDHYRTQGQWLAVTPAERKVRPSQRVGAFAADTRDEVIAWAEAQLTA